MYPVLFHIGRINFYTHGLFIALGATLGGLVIFYLAKKEGLPKFFLFDMLVFSLFSGIIGARILYVILYYYQFENWREMLYIWHGGLVSYGGIILGFIVASMFLKRHKQNIWQWFDIGIVGVLTGFSLGRIGCLLTGDVPGVYSQSYLSIWNRIPISLFEAIWCLIIVGIVLYLYTKRKNWLQSFGDGFVFILSIFLYSIGRFVIEFWRDDIIIWLVRASQIGALGILIVATVVLIIIYRRRRRSDV